MYYNYTITDFIYSIQYNRNVLQFYVGSILRKSIYFENFNHFVVEN